MFDARQKLRIIVDVRERFIFRDVGSPNCRQNAMIENEKNGLATSKSEYCRFSYNGLLEGIQIIDYNWRYIYVNDVLLEQYQTPSDELLGYSILDKFPDLKNTSVFTAMKKSMSARISKRMENKFVFKDGSERWFDLHIRPCDEGITILSLDITTHKNFEEKLVKANSLYAFLSQINQNIVHSKDVESLLVRSCQIAVDSGKFKMAWTGFFNDVENTIDMSAQSGFPTDLTERFQNRSIKKGGPQYSVWNSGQHYICHDIQNAPEFSDWKQFAEKYNISSCILLPLKIAGKTVGTLNLYSDKVRFSDDDEIALLIETASDISFALESFRKAEAHKAAEEKIVKNEEKFKHTLDNMLEGAQIHDFDWKYTYVNDAVVNFGIYSREELIGYTLMEKYPGIESSDLFKTFESCMISRQSAHVETEFVFPNGTIAFFDINIQPIPEGIFISSIDRSERQKAKVKLEKVNRLYAFNSAINQSIVHITDEQVLLQKTCEIATEIGGFQMAWIGFFERDCKTITLAAHFGIPKHEVELFANLSYAENSPQHHVLSNNTYYNCENIFDDANLESWRPFAKSHAINSGIVLPIRKNGNIIGTLNLYSTKANFADEEEISLLLEVTGDISFALDVFEKTKKQAVTEALVVANEKRFRALIEKSADMKTLARADGTLIYGSPSITKILGYHIDDIENASVFENIHPDDLPGFLQIRKAALEQNGSSYQFQIRILHKQGHYVWVEGTVTNMLNEPDVEALVSNFIDVTDKKLDEQRRTFDRNNLNALINNTKDLMWSVDRNFKLITSNRPFDRLMTSRHGQPMQKGTNVLDDDDSERIERYRRNYERAFSGEAFTQIDFYDSMPPVWAQISFYPIWNGQEIVGTACHSSDITDQKILEESLRRTIRKFSDYKYALDESAIVSITDNEGIMIHVNDNFCKISKYSRQELLGQDHRLVNSGYHPKSYMRTLWKTISAGKTWRGEIKNRAKDGAFYWVDATIIPFLNDDQGPYQYLAIRNDITQRKLADEQLMLNNAKLQKTNLELDRFVYSISHDLRSPLTSILGLLSLIEEETNEDDTLDHAKMIRSRIHRLDDFIKNILNYSRNNRTDLTIEKINLDSVARDVVDSLCSMKDARGISFQIDFEETVEFYSDRQGITTIMENLVSNAIKFHDDKSAAKYIKISGYSTRDHSYIRVADNGIGISPAYQQQVFDMFFRLSSKNDGSGIGLYIVKEVVEKLHGTIELDSEEGYGSTFHIKLKNLKYD